MKRQRGKAVKHKNISSKRNEKNTKQLKGFYLNDKVGVFGKCRLYYWVHWNKQCLCEDDRQ